MKIAINGMGRIGRLLFRRILQQTNWEIVAVNDVMDTDNLAYLLRYDSLYGTYSDKIIVENGNIVTGGFTIKAFREADPTKLPWKDLGIDIVIESSGKFSAKNGAERHLSAGAKKVLLSTTGSVDIPLLIYGFNHHQLTAQTNIVSPGGCMTNCATHVLYILNSIGIEAAQLSTLHSYTSRQELVDTAHSQYRRGRAAAESIIPVEIDLADSLKRLLPLENKIATTSIRVPVTNGALMDFVVQLRMPRSVSEINNLFRKAADNEYKNILAYTEDPIVSADIKGNTHSCIIDGTLTSVVRSQLRIVGWFDNEYGYTSRILDWLCYMKQYL